MTRLIDGLARPLRPAREIALEEVTFVGGVAGVYERKSNIFVVAWAENSREDYAHCTSSDAGRANALTAEGGLYDRLSLTTAMPGRIGISDSGSPCPVYSITSLVVVAGARPGGVAVWAGSPAPAVNVRQVWTRPARR